MNEKILNTFEFVFDAVQNQVLVQILGRGVVVVVCVCIIGTILFCCCIFLWINSEIDKS
jgi:hypothetical protein